MDDKFLPYVGCKIFANSEMCLNQVIEEEED